MKNFPIDNFSSSELKLAFQKYGAITSAAVMFDDYGKSKGYGFVCFDEITSAMIALQDAPQSTGFYVNEAKSKDQRDIENKMKVYKFKKSVQYMNLYVKGIDHDTTEDQVRNFFMEFGIIKSIKIIPEACRAFVCFEDRDSAQLAKDEGS